MRGNSPLGLQSDRRGPPEASIRLLLGPPGTARWLKTICFGMLLVEHSTSQLPAAFFVCLFVCLSSFYLFVYFGAWWWRRRRRRSKSLQIARAPHWQLREPSVEELDPEALPILKLLWF